MTFVDVVKDILAATSDPITPQVIRELIKKKYPQYYGTPSHINNVAKGRYKDLDHALLAQIYGLVRMKKSFFCDRTHKPMKISLRNNKARPKLRPQILLNEDNMRNEDDLNTDEVFIVLNGEMSIEFVDGKVDLSSGEIYVVPKGIKHKPYAESECEMLLYCKRA